MAHPHGIHHVTAIATDPQANVDFYLGVLGLRFVKTTVNFDDPGTYHLYYGNEAGDPGTVLTFFPWPGAPKGRIGAGQATTFAFSVPEGALGWWADHLTRLGIDHSAPTRRYDEEVVTLRDPDGITLELVAHAGAPDAPPWERGPIAVDHAVRGFHSLTLTEHALDPTHDMMTDKLQFRVVDEAGGRVRYDAGAGGPGTIVDVLAAPDTPRGLTAAGTVHHVAFRAPNLEVEMDWRGELLDQGVNVTEMRDRQYFKSIYFREPGGVLFEVATDEPGFATDEPLLELGRSLKLPPWLEPSREQIQRALPPLKIPAINYPDLGTDAQLPLGGIGVTEGSSVLDSHVHVHVPAQDGQRHTLVLLHGTGGDERQLVELGRAIAPGAGLLGVKGNVREAGTTTRWFRRLREGVFDTEDAAARADQLADFLGAAVAAYGLDPDSLIAVGFSNGANVAAATMLRRPGVLRGSVLVSSMLPLRPDPLPDLATTGVLMVQGRVDPYAPADEAEALAGLLSDCGASVEVVWHDDGHALGPAQAAEAARWLTAFLHGTGASPGPTPPG